MKKSFLIKIILSISFFFINIFGVLLMFSFNLNFYKIHFNSIEISESMILNVENVYDFLQGKEFINTDFTKSEYEHLDDVRTIFTLIYFVFRIFLFLCAVLTIYLIFMSKYSIILNGLIFGSLISLLFVLLLMIFSFLDFGSTFNLFHELFFPQGNWSFPPNSLLIQLFPESFFVSTSKYIFLSIFGISVFVVSISIVLKKASK